MEIKNKTWKDWLKHFFAIYIRLILGIFAFVLGLALMFIPFLPIGYIFVFVSLFFLATYLPPVKRFLDYLKSKDEKGILEKVEDRIEAFEDRFIEEE